jgi:hypothetical protein
MASDVPGNGAVDHTSGDDSDIRFIGKLERDDGARDEAPKGKNGKPSKRGAKSSVVQGEDKSGTNAPGIIEQMFARAQEKRVEAPDDPDAEHNYPFLWELLTIDRYPDGRDRFLAEIVIQRLPGVYLARIKDHETLQEKHAQSNTLHGVFEALEKALGNPQSPFRKFKSYSNKDGIERHKEK